MVNGKYRIIIFPRAYLVQGSVNQMRIKVINETECHRSVTVSYVTLRQVSTLLVRMQKFHDIAWKDAPNPIDNIRHCYNNMSERLDDTGNKLKESLYLSKYLSDLKQIVRKIKRTHGLAELLMPFHGSALVWSNLLRVLASYK